MLSPTSGIWTSRINTSTSVASNSQDQERPSPSSSHHTTDSVTKKTPLDTFINFSPISQRETSSSTLTTTRESLDIPLGSTPESQKMSTEDSLLPSTSQTTPFPSSSQPPRTLESSRANSLKELNTRTLIRTSLFSPQLTSPSEVTSRSTDTPSTSSPVMSTPRSICLHTCSEENEALLV